MSVTDPPPPPPPPIPPWSETADAPPQADFWARVLRPIAAVLGGFVFTIIVAGVLLATPLAEDTATALATVAGAGAILALGLLFLRLLPAREQRAALAWHGGRLRGVLVGFGCGLLIILGSAITIGIAAKLDQGVADRLEEQAVEIGASPLQIILAVIALVILAPLGEELVFRALLVRGLLTRLRFWPAAVISGLIFASAHIDAYVLWPRAITLALTGVFLAWLFVRRGYWTAVAAHATVNGVAAIALIAAG